jgi:hypothetical protein
MAKLTVAAVKAAKHDPSKGTRPVQIGDGDGLRLQIASGGGKSWLFRYMLAGRSREMGLGSVDFVTLAEARQRAADARRQLAQGVDPIDARREADRVAKVAQANARENNFTAMAERYVAVHEPSWRNPKHRAQWRSTLETYAYPVLGDKAVRDITTDDVVRVLRPIWLKKPETASRLRGRIEAILDSATGGRCACGRQPGPLARAPVHVAGRPRKGGDSPASPGLPWD